MAYNNYGSSGRGSSGYSGGGSSGGSGGWGAWVIIIILAILGGGGTKLISNMGERDGTVNEVKEEIRAESSASMDSTVASTNNSIEESTTDSTVKGSSEDVKDEDSASKLDSNGNINIKNGKITAENLPAYTGEFKIITINNLNGNQQQTSFTKSDLNMEVGCNFSELDSYGRVGVANGMLNKTTLPTVDREDTESISGVKPTGWNNKKVKSDGKNIWLYNRSHLIAFSLSGETANKQNLMTGTRWMNMPGMTTFETIVRDYIKDGGGKVRYRVTPIFKGEELLARGVQMEGYSVEDNGKSVSFNVFIYNVQDDVSLNYATGIGTQK